MDFWFTELHTPTERLSWKVERVLFRGRSPFQDIAVIETNDFGRMLVMDGFVMTTEKDEFVYHEMMAHVPLAAHPAPRKVLIVGGGDGGVLREVLRHPGVESATLVEIDRLVLEVSREFLPSLANGFDDPRATVLIGDGLAHVRETETSTYDVVIVDGTDPSGPGEVLFGGEFYRDVARILTPDGIVATHLSENPFSMASRVLAIRDRIAGSFSRVGICRADIPSYHTGTWYFCVATNSRDADPASPRPGSVDGIALKYYSPAIHRAAFVLPPYVEELLAKGSGAPSRPST